MFVLLCRGGTTEWNTLLWPHRGWLDPTTNDINGKRVYDYNFQLSDRILPAQNNPDNGVLCHEMNHSLGAPDLYHQGLDGFPVGPWDLMDMPQNPPQHMGAYMKYKYGGWIPSIPVITNSGTYTLQTLAYPTNNCYKIPIKNSSQYLVLEYRKKTGTLFDSRIPGSGLIIYRINEDYRGNYDYGTGGGGKFDEVYIFRQGETISSEGNCSNAHFSQTTERTTFSNNSDPYCFTVPDGDYGNIYIKNIQEKNSYTLSFDVRFCDNDNVIHSNTSNLPSITNASNSIQTSGSVIVKPTDNVIFEAKEQVILNGGFEVQPGASFKINMNGCGEK